MSEKLKDQLEQSERSVKVRNYAVAIAVILAALVLVGVSVNTALYHRSETKAKSHCGYWNHRQVYYDSCLHERGF